MVQFNELRVGNLMHVGNGIYERVLEILCDSITTETKQGIFDFEGIPLTPEILEKAGFKYDEGMESYDLFTSSGLISIATDYSFFIGDNHLECGFAGGNKSLVKYLHQLQNLYFALTGEELQIEL